MVAFTPFKSIDCSRNFLYELPAMSSTLGGGRESTHMPTCYNKVHCSAILQLSLMGDIGFSDVVVQEPVHVECLDCHVH